MKKLAEIDCGCGCGNRVKLYWDSTCKKIISKDTHGNTDVVEQHYSCNTLRQAKADIDGWYADYTTWHLVTSY